MKTEHRQRAPSPQTTQLQLYIWLISMSFLALSILLGAFWLFTSTNVKWYVAPLLFAFGGPIFVITGGNKSGPTGGDVPLFEYASSASKVAGVLVCWIIAIGLFLRHLM
ncbi:MAG: hypothetical protein Q7U16_12780 [Agitococcus sp.]|nr:hypothetical protein [Agitococcus sp.]